MVAKAVLRAVTQRFQRRRFAILFLALILAVGLYPALKTMPWGGVLFEAFLGVTLLGVIASLELRRVNVLIALFVALLAARLAHAGLETSATDQIGQGVWIVCGALGLFVSAQYAVRSGPADSERLFAALSAYLLGALTLGTCFWVMETLSPGALASASGRAVDFSGAIYFSFVTIATLGYGDITPVSDPARGLAVFEAVGGQIYLVVLVARLVTLYSNRTASTRDNGGSLSK
jgi:hypothetical protein